MGRSWPGSAGRGLDGRRLAGHFGRLRLPRRRDVLRRGRPAPGLRLCGPAAADPAPVRRLGGPVRGIADGRPDPARPRDGAHRGPDRADRPRPRRNATGADPGGDHGRPLRLSRRRPSRHHDRAGPARLGDHPVAPGEAARGRRSAPLAGRRRHGGDRPGEQGHAPVPGRGVGGRARPGAALGCRSFAVGLVGDRDRAPVVVAEPRLAGGERLAAAHDGPGHLPVRRRQPRPDRAAAVALQRPVPVPGDRRRSDLGSEVQGGGAVARDRDRRSGGTRPGRRSAAERPTTRSAACRCSWRPGRSSSTAGWLAATRA